MKIFNVVVVLIFSSFSLKAIDGKFYKGSDLIIAQSQLDPFFFPSQRYGLVKVFESIRFNQTTGPWDPKIPAHPQSLEYEGTRLNQLYGPQTSFDSLVQLLFPSPDGTTLMPNQASSDVVSELTPQDVAALIQLTQNPEVKIEDVRSSIFPEIEFSDELMEKYQAFLKYEHFRQVVDKTYSALGDSDYEKREISPQDPNRASKVLRLATPQYFRENGLKEGEVEAYALAQEAARFLSSKKPSKPQLEKIKYLEANHPDLLFFERNRRAFTAYRFADTFLKALKENTTPIENGVEKALLSYMWLKFRKDEERRAFYRKLNVLNADQLFVEGYERSDYNTVKSKPAGLLTPEELALYRYGFDIFENPFPTPLPYSTATVVLKDREYSFSDCAESAVLSVLLYKVRKLSNGRYQVDSTVFAEESPLRSFFEKYEEEDLYTAKAHDDFAQMVCNLEGVEYLKPAGDPKKKFELKPGLLNLLRVLGTLIPELRDLKTLNQNSEEAKIQGGINSLAQYLAPEGKRWTARIFGQDYKAHFHTKGEIYADVFVEDCVEGESAKTIFYWTNEPGHSVLNPSATRSVSFSEDAEEMAKDPLKLSFLTLSDLSPCLEVLSDVQFSQVFLQQVSWLAWEDYCRGKTMALKKKIKNLYFYFSTFCNEDCELLFNDTSLNISDMRRMFFSTIGFQIPSSLKLQPKYQELALEKALSSIYVFVNLCPGPQSENFQHESDFYKKVFQHPDFFQLSGICINIDSLASGASFLGGLEGILSKSKITLDIDSLDLSSNWLESWLNQRNAGTVIRPRQIIKYDSIEEAETRICALYAKFPKLVIVEVNDHVRECQPTEVIDENGFTSTQDNWIERVDENLERLNRALGSRKLEEPYFDD